MQQVKPFRELTQLPMERRNLKSFLYASRRTGQNKKGISAISAYLAPAPLTVSLRSYLLAVPLRDIIHPATTDTRKR